MNGESGTPPFPDECRTTFTYICSWLIGQVLSAALTVVDVGMTVVDTVQIATELYDFMRFRPDFTIEVGGESHFGEIKLQSTGDFDRPGQEQARRALNDANEVKPINEAACGCGPK